MSNEFSEELIASLDVTEAGMKDGINGNAGLKPPKVGGVSPGAAPAGAGGGMPQAPGAGGALPVAGKSGPGGLQAPGAPGGQAPPGGALPGGGAGAQNIPPSQFAQNQEVPQIEIDPLKHPDDHEHDEKCAAEGDHVITAEYCLEQFARVQMELAEQQEDPLWVEAHRTLAEMWQVTAQMLLQFRIDAQQNAGEIELKQQQLQQQHEMHQQTLAQGDQLHAQTMTQNDQMHQQGMDQKDEQHKLGIQQGDEQHKFKMDSAGKQDKLKLDTQTKASQMTLQAKKQSLSKPAPKKTS